MKITAAAAAVVQAFTLLPNQQDTDKAVAQKENLVEADHSHSAVPRNSKDVDQAATGILPQGCSATS